MKDEAFGELGEAQRRVRGFPLATVSDAEVVDRARTRTDRGHDG
jgi:hypothetical protein